jgi:uncharacterized repeat protein (TIGR03803 family)
MFGFPMFEAELCPNSVPTPIADTPAISRRKPARLALMLGMIFLATHSVAAAQTLTTLYSFQSSTDAVFVDAPLIIDTAGNLYGISSSGGTGTCNYGNYCGTFFEISPPAVAGNPWTETIIYNFNVQGYVPQGTLVMDKTGSIYLTTAGGGLSQTGCDGGGCGVLLKFIPPASPGGTWTRKLVHSFSGGSDGGVPNGIVLGSDGILYGATDWGGSNGGGTMYSVQLTGSFPLTTLYSFGAAGDASIPHPPMRDSSNNVYGTSTYGGAYGLGSIFKLTSPASPGGAWTESVLYSSQNDSITGYEPSQSLMLDRKGNLWGTMTLGGENNYGTIYELVAEANGSWRYKDIHDSASVDTIYGMIFDGANDTFYGSSPYNSFFTLSPPSVAGGTWSYTTIYTLPADGSLGGDPLEALTLGREGNLYGSTGEGGAYGYGTIFQFTP